MATDGRLAFYKENQFPNLLATGYRITSPITPAYNCFAWAAEQNDRWWNPLEPTNPYYWIDGVSAELTIAAFIQAYATFGYVPCEDATLETGFDKIALYAKSDGEVTHAARQLPNGKWMSKLGRWEDIEHELEELCGEFYGTVQQVLKRSRQE
ncbi:hypothetical protein [Alkalinema sp. FACHB-956]|uniref:DUF7689 domain-containing protein n=1 Tax=Alkalinema sp. FACHB-956 TaxID=2692768 RepID=UPI0016884C69|nr:hypothetical protein [Alkalinema sp. FACHB-956]MBD2326241.1 hypothetical protein [Alkalinema sp. FACHB-956]